MITALAGAAGLFVFILPVFTGRILNIGNMTGILVSLCLLLYQARQSQIHALAVRNWKAGGLRCGLLILTGTALAAIVLTALVLTFMIVRAALTRPAPRCILCVLGRKRGE